MINDVCCGGCYHEVEALRKFEPPKSIVERGKALFQRIIPKKVQEGVGNVVNGSARFFSATDSTEKFINSVVTHVKSPVETASKTAQISNKSSNVVSAVIKKINMFKVIPIVTAPFVLISLALSIKNLVNGIFEKIAEKIADSVLDIINSASDITRLVSLFVINPIFSAVTGFFAVISGVIHTKQLCQSIKFQKDLMSLESLDGMGDYQIKKRLNVDPSIVKDLNLKDEDVKIALRKRSIQQTLSHALQLVAAAVSVVATAILIACPPLAPVALGLFALSAVIVLGDFIMDKIIAYQFKKVCKSKKA